MSWFKRGKTAVLGIDISSSAVKLLELSKNGSDYRVENYEVEPLPIDAVLEKNIVDIDSVVDALKKTIRKSKTKLKHACVAVAGTSVLPKVIQMPADLSEKEMEEEIIDRIDQIFPSYEPEKDSFDFEILGESSESPLEVDVLLAASQTEKVDDRVEVLAQAGLKAKIVDLEVFATENAYLLLSRQLPKKVRNKTVAIIDIGATMTTLNILSNYRSIYKHEQNFGGKELTNEIKLRYGLSYEEAGNAKRNGSVPDGYKIDILEPFKQALVQQISRALQLFSLSSASRDITSIILAGGCASIEEIDQTVEKALNIKTYIANPFSMSVSNKKDSKTRLKASMAERLSNDAPTLVIACGLALRSFD